MNEAARNLSALPNLQELGLYNNELTGRLGGDSALCQLAQGNLEMLQLGGMGLTGSLPACLFDGNSTLYQVGGVGWGVVGGWVGECCAVEVDCRWHHTPCQHADPTLAVVLCWPCLPCSLPLPTTSSPARCPTPLPPPRACKCSTWLG